MTLDDDNCDIYDVNDKFNDKFNDSQELSFSYSINDIIKIIKLEKQKKYTNNIIISYFVMFVMIICMTSMLILGNNNYNNSDYELYGFYGNILFKYYYITNILWYLGFIFMSIYLIVYILSCSHRKELYNDIAFFKYVKINTITLAYNIILKCSYGIFIFLLTATQNNKTNYNITLYYNYIIIDICMFMLVNEIIKIILSRLNKII